MKINEVIYREAVESDLSFMKQMLLEACKASGVFIEPDKLKDFPDTEMYIKDWPREKELGIVAETKSGEYIGVTWIRNLPQSGHSIHEPLPEITIAVVPQYRKMGIANNLMKQLYEVSAKQHIPKLSLGVHQANIPAIRLYEKQGWSKDGEFHEYVMMSRNV